MRCRCRGARCKIERGDQRHGTANGYGNLGCRCDPCCSAHTLSLRERKRRRIARGIPEHVHGTANGYGNYGCRCRHCQRAWNRDTLERRHLAKQGRTRVGLGLQAAPKRRLP